jgi:peptidoglycan hydrolase-like protein with peptidoglycan-binding domain
MSRQTIINTATAENGTKESPPNSNKTKYGKWYGLNGVKWCAIFVSFVYDHAGHPLERIDTAKGYQSCQSGYNFWKKNNRFTREPQPGDIVLYDWTGDGVCDHTGIFVRWLDSEKTRLQTWEGNTALGNDSDGGEVMLRERERSLVRAFVTPIVLGDPSPVHTDDIVRKGDIDSNVTVIQKMLHDLDYNITVDGIFGDETERIVKQFQEDHSLQVTGIVTTELTGAMEEELSMPRVTVKKFTTGSFISKGNSGHAVLKVQEALNKKGANPPLEENGVFNSATVFAAKEFQKKNQLGADGIVGPKTFSALEITGV